MRRHGQGAALASGLGGEGGAVLTSKPLLKRAVESLRDWGRDCWCASGKDNTCGRRFQWKLGQLPEGYDHKYTYSHIGYNLKATDMQAAVGVSQLGKLDGFIAARRRNLIRLADALPMGLALAGDAELLAWRTALTVSGTTVCGYVSHIRGFYAWALERGIVPSDPAARLPVPRRPQLLPRPIAEEALMAALACAPRRIRLWLILAGWAGLRACEVAFLRAENIRLSAAQPYIHIAADATKGIRERTVPLCAFAAGELSAAGLPRRGWAFLRHDGQAGPNMPWLIRHLANDWLHDCGYPDTLHSLRHRFGTQVYRARHDLLALAAVMGHQHLQSTAGYAAFDQSEAAAAIEALPVPPRLRRAS